MNSIGFLQSMLEYYRPRLDASTLSDTEFIKEMGYLLRLRQMERTNQVEKTIENLFT